MKKIWVYDFYLQVDWTQFFSLGISSFFTKNYISIAFLFFPINLSFEWHK